MALNFSDLYWLSRKYGLDHESARMAAAIALAESGGRPEALGDRGSSYGLWQIHLPAHPWARGMNLFDPEQNVQAMVRISGGGTNWRPWTVFRTGAYRRFLDEPIGAAPTTTTTTQRRRMVIPTGTIRALVSRDLGQRVEPARFADVRPIQREPQPQQVQPVNLPGFQGLNPDFATRLSQLFAAIPGLRVTSGYRSVAEQAALWEKYGRNPRRVAPPGRSKHNFGLAADIAGSPEAMRRAHQLAPQFGLVFPMSWEPWHIELAGARTGQLPQPIHQTAPQPPRRPTTMVLPTGAMRTDPVMLYLRDRGVFT